MKMENRRTGSTHLPQPDFQILQLALLNDQMPVIVKVFDYVVVSLLVIFEYDGFDRRVTFDEDAWLRSISDMPGIFRSERKRYL